MTLVAEQAAAMRMEVLWTQPRCVAHYEAERVARDAGPEGVMDCAVKPGHARFVSALNLIGMHAGAITARGRIY